MKNTYYFFLLISFIQFGCSSGPEQIKLNFDSCYYCEMVISDERFPAQIVTTTGKVYKFDAVECMIGAVEENEIDKNKIDKMYITNFELNNHWLEANNSYYMISNNIKSPMGVNAKAFATKADADKAAKLNEGNVFSWIELKGYVIDTWM